MTDDQIHNLFGRNAAIAEFQMYEMTPELFPSLIEEAKKKLKFWGARRLIPPYKYILEGLVDIFKPDLQTKSHGEISMDLYVMAKALSDIRPSKSALDTFIDLYLHLLA